MIKYIIMILLTFLLIMMVLTAVPSHSADEVIVQTLCDYDQPNCIFTHYKVGDTDTLIAEPEAGYYFAGWGGICSGRGDCTFTITQEGQRLELTARFEKLPDKPKNLRRAK